MAFSLPPLPYALNALEPHMSQETLEFHHGKHHAAYVTKLNAAVEGKPEASKSLEDLIKTSEGGVFNNAAQIFNHTHFFHSLSPNGGGAPTGAVAAKIDEAFGSFDAFKTEFEGAANTHFGSGWVWLVQGADGKLKIHQTHDAGCPLRDGAGKPILAFDVWEHAYYIMHRNVRPNYTASFWNLVNWEFANANLA